MAPMTMLKPERAEATADTIKAGLARMGKTAQGPKPAYLDLKVNGTKMATAELISQYTSLQSVELQDNEITDLSGLSMLPHLTSLDASNNKLSEVVALDPPPSNLRTLTLSNNSLTHMRDMSSYQQLRTLVLDGNQLTQLSGLGNLPFLKILSVQHNRLTTCEGLSECHSVRRLLLNHNSIQSLGPLKTLVKLESLEVADNKLTSLKGLEGSAKLGHLDCSNNLITELDEVKHASPLPLLKQLTITGNAVVNYKLSKLHIVYLIPQLEVLNGEEVSYTENVHAANLHGADAEGLKTIRKKYFPDGELDDGGGAVVPVSAGLLASNGLDAKDDEVHFETADNIAKSVGYDIFLLGLDKLGDYFIRNIPSQLGLARACWTWVQCNAGELPEFSWKVSVPALKPEAAEVEKLLVPNENDGTYAEKLSQIFASLCRACQLEANEVLGFYKHEALLPGTRLTGHNHCWNVVKVNGRWRLIDMFWSVMSLRAGQDIPFYISPEAFIYTHLPLEEWWQLLGTYVSADQFWEMPTCGMLFFTKGFYFTNNSLNGVNIAESDKQDGVPAEFREMPIAELVLEQPKTEIVVHELLDAQLQLVAPPEQPGSYSFTQVTSSEDAKELADRGMVEQRLWVSFPKQGEYFVRVKLVDGPELMMVKYIVPEGTEGKPVVFPVMSTDFLSLGCQLISPHISTALRGDMVYEWEVYAPNAASVSLGDEGAPTSCGSLHEVSPSRFGMEAAMLRVQETHVMVSFKGSQAQPRPLLSFTVKKPVHDLVAVPELPLAKATQQQQQQEIKERTMELFKQVDLNHDGVISRGELAVGLRSIEALSGLLGLPEGCATAPSAAQFNELYAELDTSGTGQITLADFHGRMQQVAENMPRVVVDYEVMQDGKVEVKLSEEVPHVSVGCDQAMDGSVHLNIASDQK